MSTVKSASIKSLKESPFVSAFNKQKQRYEPVIFGNGIRVDLPHVDFRNGIELASGGAPSVVTNKLYNENGELKFNGQVIGTGSLSSAGGWTDDGSTVRLTTATDSVGIGTSSPSYKLDITGDARIFGDDGYNSSGERAKLYFGDGLAGVYSEYGLGLVFAVYKSSGNGGLVDGSGNSMDVIWIAETSGQVGIGTSSPDTLLELSKDSADTELTISTYHNTEATTPKLTLRKADNTEASPALVDDNAVLGTISFQGYDGSGFEQGAKIEARVDGTPSDGSDMPTELTFWTTPDGSATAVQRMTITPAGNVAIDEDQYLYLNGASDANWKFGKDSSHNIFLDGAGSGTRRFAVRDASDSFAERFVVDLDGGNVGIGTTAPQLQLHIDKSSDAAYIFLTRNDSTIADGEDLGGVIFGGTENGSSWADSAWILAEATEDWTVGAAEGTQISFWTTPDGSTTPARIMSIDQNGNVGIGTSTPDYDFEVERTGAEIFVHYTGQSRGGFKALQTQRLAIMTTDAADDIVLGYSDGIPADDGSDFVERMRIDNGTGDVGIGISVPLDRLHVYDNSASEFAMVIQNDGNNVNRYGLRILCGTDDGSGENYPLFIYDGDGTAHGGITLEDGTVAISAFTGQHYTDLEPGLESYDFGTILKIVSCPPTYNKSVDYVCAQTTTAKDPAVLGVYNSNMENAPAEGLRTKHTVWSVGDGYALVCSEGGDISIGDYICSSGTAGHGMKQDDDLMHNYTVAKASEPVIWSEESSTKKLIACTYHCG